MKQEKGSHGRSLKYGSRLEMADYLSPNYHLATNDKRLIFQKRSQSNPLPANRGDPHPCVKGCGEVQDNCHIIQCSRLNEENKGDYYQLVNGNLHYMKTNLEKWKKNFTIIEAMDSL